MQFVYDPHIAPHLEEWLAAHRAAFSFPGASTRVAVAVPVGAAVPVSGSGSGHATPRVRDRRGVPSQGRSSARKDPHATVISLRRRSGRKGSDETHELREALIDDARDRNAGGGEHKGSYTYTRIADDDDKAAEGGYGGYGGAGDGEGEGDDWGRPSAYELKESVVLGDTSGWTEKRSDATRAATTRDEVPRQRKLSDPPHPARRGSKGLIDLTHPRPRGEGGAEDAEVREVIFNYAPSTIGTSGASTPLRQQTSATGAGTGGAVPPYSALGGGINPFLLGIAPDIHASPGDMPITLTLPGQAGSPGRVASGGNAGPALSLSDTPGLLDHAGLVQDTLGPESTTFSFLSLSQASSPEVPTSLLGSWTLGQAVTSTSPSASASASEFVPPLSDFASRLHSPPTAGRGLGHGHGHGYDHEYNHGPRSSAEDEVVSLPETSTSGYEDAEYYSPETRSRAGSPVRSPTRVVPAFPREWPVFNTERYTDAEYEGGAGELGMVWADTRRGNGHGNSIGNAIADDSGSGGGAAALRRGPLSVVSLSESEGWRSDDFEGETSA